MDMKLVRAKELSAIIQSSGKCNLLEKFGAIMLYNQMIEEKIKNLIVFSNKENHVHSKINLDSLTFGKLLEKFDEYVIKTRAYNELSHSLNECRIFRNALVHKIFNIEYFFDIVEIADELIKAQEKIIDDLDLYKIEVEK